MTKINVQVSESSEPRVAEPFVQAHPARENHEQIIQQVLARWSKFISDESIERALAFRPQQNDVMIATHSKSGTTLVQQIIHQLRSKGDLNYTEISEVVPWVEMAFDTETNLDQAQTYEPRAFKTHFDWESVPKNLEEEKLVGKYIYVARNPYSVVVSFYLFLLDWFFTADEIRFCDFVEIFLYHRSVPYWKHISDWFKAAEKYPENILWFFFEDLVLDRENAIRRIAEFTEIPKEDLDERIEKAVEYSSIEWMKQNGDKFDEKISKKYRNHVFGAVGNDAVKVRSGSVSVSAGTMNPLLKDEIATILAKNWKELLGIETYEQLRELVFSSDVVQVFRPQSLKDQ